MDSKKNYDTRTPADYARQQEDIRATQVHGESSLHRDTEQPELNRTSEDRERAQGVQKGTGKPVEDAKR